MSASSWLASTLASAFQGGSPGQQQHISESLSVPVANGDDVDDDDDDNVTTSWNDYYFQLVFFKATQEHTNVPSDFVCKTGLALGKWVIRQRSLLAASFQQAETENKPLPPSIAVHIEKLKEIGFDFDSESSAMRQNNSNGKQAIVGPIGDSSFSSAQAVGTSCPGPMEGVSKDEGCSLSNPVKLKDGPTRQHETGGEQRTESLSTEKSEEATATEILTAHPIIGSSLPAVSTGQQQNTTRQLSGGPPRMQMLPLPGAPQQHNELQRIAMRQSSSRPGTTQCQMVPRPMQPQHAQHSTASLQMVPPNGQHWQRWQNAMRQSSSSSWQSMRRPLLHPGAMSGMQRSNNEQQQ
jgi:Helicase associated domain